MTVYILALYLKSHSSYHKLLKSDLFTTKPVSVATSDKQATCIKQACIHFLKKASILNCTTIHSYPIFSTRYSIMCKVYTGYCGTSEIEHGLCACTVDNPLAKARGLSLRTGAQTMLYLPHVAVLSKHV